jgi:aminobenzoyl-glutamate utilization protein B
VAATWAPGTPGHTWQVVAQGKGDIAHKMMLWSAKVIGLSAIRILQNPSSLKAVKEEFQETMQTRAYRPLSAEVKPRPVADLVS